MEPYQSPYQTLGYEKTRPITVQYSLPRQPYQPFQAIPPLLVGKLSGASDGSGSTLDPGSDGVDSNSTQQSDHLLFSPSSTVLNSSSSRGTTSQRETQLSKFTSSVMGKIYELSDMTLFLASTKFEKMLSKREEDPAAPPNSFVALPPDPILHITHCEHFYSIIELSARLIDMFLQFSSSFLPSPSPSPSPSFSLSTVSRTELECLYYDFRIKSEGEEYFVPKDSLGLLINDIRFPPSSAILRLLYLAILSSVQVSKVLYHHSTIFCAR